MNCLLRWFVNAVASVASTLKPSRAAQLTQTQERTSAQCTVRCAPTTTMLTGTPSGTNTMPPVVRAKLGKPEPVCSYPPPPVREDGTDMQLKENLFSIIGMDTLIWVRDEEVPYPVAMWRALQSVPDREEFGLPRHSPPTQPVYGQVQVRGVYVRLRWLIA